MPVTYDRISKLLHWLVAALVVTQLITALTWPQYGDESMARYVLFRIHMFSGIAILILMVMRLAWRQKSPWRPLPDDVPPAVRIAARANHVAFYVALILQPLLGLLMISPFGGAGSWLNGAHVILGWTVVVLVVLHVAGALWHGFVRKDQVMQRMLPFTTADR
ncbi:MAG TPA: cytochrome b/b6 domain-containing protein [Geminicoccus sp.]|uniref:cytochrome b n=1 Tax=Geminicoccus sp. TaxID=2024832 RepID=UPI002C11BF99|nr:cytochrome b/b6 domain-containing protein [Geminicoccus sp.]HWL72224.1 cytochrome b/b6 domain-containing protein [Geminicoccus sp.]